MSAGRVRSAQATGAWRAGRARAGGLARRDALWGYLMIAPLYLGLLLFYIWPAGQTIYFSFTEWGAFGRYEWAGPANYERLVADPEVRRAFRNTFVFTALSVPISILLAIVVAVLLNQRIRGMTIYRTLYFLPVVTMPAAVAMVWRWLYNGDYGLVNYLLGLLAIRGPRWLSDPKVALLALVAVAVWSSIGYNMVILLAGLQGIPASLYEAASLDGAGPLQRFFRITIPLLTPAIFFVTVISLIDALQVFDLVYMMIGPESPAIGGTQSVVYLFFDNAFVTGDKGYAAAIVVILFLVILILTVIQFALQRRLVHYG